MLVGLSTDTIAQPVPESKPLSVAGVRVVEIHMIASVRANITRRLSTSSKTIMGFTKEIVRNGNGSKPRVGQTVTGRYRKYDRRIVKFNI
jgi:hypothetical protein